MNFLSDHDVFGTTVRLLRDAGHNVTTASEAGLAAAKDEQILQVAQANRRILLTRDRDFGQLVFVSGAGGGIIYLRMLPGDQQSVHAELMNVLDSYSEDKLYSSFVVVEPGRHRIRELKP